VKVNLTKLKSDSGSGRLLRHPARKRIANTQLYSSIAFVIILVTLIIIKCNKNPAAACSCDTDCQNCYVHCLHCQLLTLYRRRCSYTFICFILFS